MHRTMRYLMKESLLLTVDVCCRSHTWRQELLQQKEANLEQRERPETSACDIRREYSSKAINLYPIITLKYEFNKRKVKIQKT